LGLGKV